MVKGPNKKGQLRAIHAKDPYVRRGRRLSRTILQENESSRSRKTSLLH